VKPQLPITAVVVMLLPARRGAQRVPKDLRVEMGVPVDKAGRDDMPFCVDLAPRRLAAKLADGGNAPSLRPTSAR
jgi:hypothetical protein